MNEVQLLPFERWRELEEIFEREFDSALPDKNTAQILFKQNNNGKITAFLVVEMLVRVGQIYSDRTNTRSVHQLVKYVSDNTADGASVIAIASEPRFEPLCVRMKMRAVEGRIYRKDF